MGFFTNWDGIKNAFFSICLILDAIVYSLISYVYQIFMVLAGSDSILDEAFISSLVERVYLIIGVVMLFVLAYSLLKSMINPDEALKGKTSPTKFIINVVTSVVLIAVIPTIFEFANDFSMSILKNNTIGKIIVGNNTEAADNISQGGYFMAESVLHSFLHTDGNGPDDKSDGEVWCESLIEEEEGNRYVNGAKGEKCKKMELIENNNLISNTISKGLDVTGTALSVTSFSLFNPAAKGLFWLSDLVSNIGATKSTYGQVWAAAATKQSFFPIGSLSKEITAGNVFYLPIVSTLIGAYILYVLALYAIEIAVRLVKLTVYQLLAPIPILARLIPGEQGNKTFQNWIKAVVSTYVEVFIRIALLFMCVLLCQGIVMNVGNIFGGLVTQYWGTARWDILFIAQALVIVGIVLFVKQAPQLLKDITGMDSGKYVKPFVKGLGMLAGSLGGGATAAIRSFANDKETPLHDRFGRAVGAGIGAGRRGLWNGSKIEKLGDIPKGASKASADTLSEREKRSRAGGFLEYQKLKATGVKDKVVNWMESQDSKRIQDYASKLDADVSSAQGVFKKTQAHIDAKALYTKLKNEFPTYEDAWTETLQETSSDIQGSAKKAWKDIYTKAAADPRTKDTTAADYVSLKDLATQMLQDTYGVTTFDGLTEKIAQDKYGTTDAKTIAESKFIKSYGKTIEGMRSDLKAAEDNVASIETSEMTKKISVVASAARDFNFRMESFKDISINEDEAFERAAGGDSGKFKGMKKAFEQYKDLQGDDLYNRLVKDVQEGHIKQVQAYVDAMDAYTNAAKEMASREAFKETVFKAKKEDAGGDKK